MLAVGAVVRNAGFLLVVKRGMPPEAGRWSLPGGKVEVGETIRQAVVRELREETGLDGTCGDLVGWVERIGPGTHFVILDFAVEVQGVEVQGVEVQGVEASPGDDAAEVAWVELGEVGSLDLVSGLEAFLREHGVIPGGEHSGGARV